MKAFAEFTSGAAEASRAIGEAMLPAFRAFAEMGESLIAMLPPALLNNFANATPAPEAPVQEVR